MATEKSNQQNSAIRNSFVASSLGLTVQTAMLTSIPYQTYVQITG